MNAYGIYMLCAWGRGGGAGAGLCSFTHPCVVDAWRRPGWAELLQGSHVLLWSQPLLWSHPQRGKGEQGLPGPSGPKGEKGARVSAPAMSTAERSHLCPGVGLECEPSSHHFRWKPAAWSKQGMRDRVSLGVSVRKPVSSRGTCDYGILGPILLKTGLGWLPWEADPLLPTSRAMTVFESPRTPRFR